MNKREGGGVVAPNKKNAKTPRYPYVSNPNPKKVTDENNPAKRLPKKKAVLILGYLGTNYKGMQRNPGVPTVEEELAKAIVAAGGMLEDNLVDLKKIGWQRCARTDKGVHAIGQIVSLKLIVDPPGVVQRINDNLPSDIRVFGLKRVTGSFNSKSFCDSRSYEYLLPTFVFSEGTEDKPLFDFENVRGTLDTFLSAFQGTHNFHNYTSRLAATDPKSHRYVISFKSKEILTLEGMQYVRLEVLGQSFLLHHIRKMIGTAVAVIRQKGSVEVVKATLTKLRFNLPIAPSNGLLLQQCHFPGYNQRHSEVHNTSLTYEDVQDQIDQFKKEVYKTIAMNEKNNQGTKKWLETIDQNPLCLEKILAGEETAENKPPRAVTVEGDNRKQSSEVE
eukprot:TRINITY_DN2106_c0_g1_i1.p1 TRINITY_DN2106_c0_g1~~TRINITY_DN2106_c0_g1_i1.p1  ORF type:complete len:389 (-),score=53.93 TRINITY_DN2106_c0_g1_i1:20-1186(-)